MIVSDPWFYVAAIPAVIIFGIGKGGLGGALGIISVPLMALVISPIQAAAILLPILCIMDILAIKQHYKNADYVLLKRLLPSAVVGVAIAGCMMQSLPESEFKVLIGGLSLIFYIQHMLEKLSKNQRSGKSGKCSAFFWSCLSGFSSTAIHAGGGPLSIYLLPLKLEKVTLIASMAVFFGVVNFFKLIPYFLAGEFDSTNLTTALVLMPFAPVGVKLGVWLLYRVSQDKIYSLCYFFLLLSGLKLIYDGTGF
ncbi:sulfite exporter TauE/SafE family protein [Vibrio salinus]|uniref:sulfite exporter TauE/SafE family protein n=1 Tax=Vibrio salinus TaxID=2899784 RepID=UPI001E452EF8|nr:sulfite exporter TauE/SafE family protein [Vibrio salinus]MCE0495314.1 sulfite exporter TauE/SafE family protein [Vibrio salinus]